MMESFFDDGKFVNDFKIIGNNKGFSVTIHLCNQPCDTLDWSPGISSKSPAVLKRDRQRLQQWHESRPISCQKSVPRISRETSCNIDGMHTEQNVNIGSQDLTNSLGDEKSESLLSKASNQNIVDSLNCDLISDCEESAVVTGDCNQAYMW